VEISIGIENQEPKATMIIESLALRFQSRRPILAARGKNLPRHVTSIAF